MTPSFRATAALALALAACASAPAPAPTGSYKPSEVGDREMPPAAVAPAPPEPAAPPPPPEPECQTRKDCRRKGKPGRHMAWACEEGQCVEQPRVKPGARHRRRARPEPLAPGP